MEELKQYDLVILSDIERTPCFCRVLRLTAVKMPNRCNLIRDYVDDGASSDGRRLSDLHSGVDAKGKWHDTAVQEVLPVEVLTVDDRMEHRRV